LVYNAYNLDPTWHTGDPFNRILLLEPAHYSTYPVSEKVISFLLALAENIPGIQVYTGNYNELQEVCKGHEIIFRKHPAYPHYTGAAEDSPQLFPQVSGSFNSFFAYWKKCERHLHDL
jgi:deoxyribodipyrimidine photo-lyase